MMGKKLKAFSLIRWLKAITTKVIEMNQVKAVYRIKEKHINTKDHYAYFICEVFGANLNLTLSAAEIANNDKLLARFSYQDKSEIIFYSGLCKYKMTDIHLADNNEWICTIEASFRGKKMSKKFEKKELVSYSLLVERLSPEEKQILQIAHQAGTVIPFKRVS
ncbi:MAG: hypothetical protein ACK4PR_00325 [Gammaproteobacteria bacterium]